MAQAITSLKKENIYYDNLEPMIDQMMLKFPHLAHDILKELDNISMANCRNISKQWCNFIDVQKFQFNELLRVIKAFSALLYLKQ